MRQFGALRRSRRFFNVCRINHTHRAASLADRASHRGLPCTCSALRDTAGATQTRSQTERASDGESQRARLPLYGRRRGFARDTVAGSKGCCHIIECAIRFDGDHRRCGAAARARARLFSGCGSPRAEKARSAPGSGETHAARGRAGRRFRRALGSCDSSLYKPLALARRLTTQCSLKR